MLMKKFQGVFVFGLLMLMFSLGFVSAESHTATLFQTFLDGLGDVIKFVLGDVTPLENAPSSIIGDLLFAKVLFFFIIAVVVVGGLRKVAFFSDNESVLWITSMSVSVLAIRFLGDAEFIQAMILPYSTLGIAISSILPFIIYYYVVGDLPRFWRRFSWILFSLVFFGLFLTRGGIIHAIDWVWNWKWAK